MYKIIYSILSLSLLFFVFTCQEDQVSVNGEKADDVKPIVSIVFPVNNSEFPEDTVITIEADASDNVSVKEVEFYINGELEFNDDTEPYRYDWDTNGKGGRIHTIIAIAYDESNNMAVSAVSIKIIAPTATVTDIEGNVCQTVKIGNQWWMAENLKVTHYRNGEEIPLVTDILQWTHTSVEGAYCYYDNNADNADTYGCLYNWYAVNDSRGLAPAGWHIPSDEEWNELEIFLGMSQSEADSTFLRGTDHGGKLKENGTTHWASPNTGATNESGFTALPGGYRSWQDGSFRHIGLIGEWWSASAYDEWYAWYRCMRWDDARVRRESHIDKRTGCSVRCARD